MEWQDRESLLHRSATPLLRFDALTNPHIVTV